MKAEDEVVYLLQFFVDAHSQEHVSCVDTLLLVILRGIARQFENFSGEIFDLKHN